MSKETEKILFYPNWELTSSLSYSCPIPITYSVSSIPPTSIFVFVLGILKGIPTTLSDVGIYTVTIKGDIVGYAGKS